jgi:hypothetical protein
MNACVILQPVSDAPNPRLTAHRMPMALANETFSDMITSAELLQKAVINDQPETELQRLRDTAKAQFEAYLDLMEMAAVHVRALKP